MSNHPKYHSAKEFCNVANQTSYPFVLPKLPFESNALIPHISEKTIWHHHECHHLAYVNNLNRLTKDTDLAAKSIEEIMQIAAKDPKMVGIFNNAAQIWNHSFYWYSMKSSGGGSPTGEFAKAIDRDFGSFENFLNSFREAATTLFGSGWVWLVLNEQNKLEIIRTFNADCPIIHGKIPLFTMDVWEHAYYIDYQHLRVNYNNVFMDHLVNWDFAADMYNDAMNAKK